MGLFNISKLIGHGHLSTTGRYLHLTKHPLLAVQALSSVYRGKFMAALAAAPQDASIKDDPQGEPAAWAQRQRQLYKHPWVVYAKTPRMGHTGSGLMGRSSGARALCARHADRAHAACAKQAQTWA